MVIIKFSWDFKFKLFVVVIGFGVGGIKVCVV